MVAQPQAQAAPEAGAPFQVPVLFHVLETERGPIVDEAWIERTLARSAAIFAPAGVAFVSVGTVPLAREHADLRGRAARHGLAAELRGRVVNVFVVDTMLDLEDPERWLRGVHWKLPEDPARHWVILTASEAGPLTLPHELGHFFGNHRHSEVPGNIMSYQGGASPTFDATQVRIVRRELRRFRRRGELDDAATVRADLAAGETLPRTGPLGESPTAP